MSRNFLNDVKFKSVKIKRYEKSDQKNIPFLLIKKIMGLLYITGLTLALIFGGKYGIESLICGMRGTEHMTLYELWQDFQLHRGE